MDTFESTPDDGPNKYYPIATIDDCIEGSSPKAL